MADMEQFYGSLDEKQWFRFGDENDWPKYGGSVSASFESRCESHNQIFSMEDVTEDRKKDGELLFDCSTESSKESEPQMLFVAHSSIFQSPKGRIRKKKKARDFHKMAIFRRPLLKMRPLLNIDWVNKVGASKLESRATQEHLHKLQRFAEEQNTESREKKLPPQERQNGPSTVYLAHFAQDAHV